MEAKVDWKTINYTYYTCPVWLGKVTGKSRIVITLKMTSDIV